MTEDNRSREPSARWEAQFQSATRLDDPEDDERFEVTFELLGPGTNGTVHVSLGELDEALIVGEGGARLEEALRAWLLLLEHRNGTGPTEPKRG